MSEGTIPRLIPQIQVEHNDPGNAAAMWLYRDLWDNGNWFFILAGQDLRKLSLDMSQAKEMADLEEYDWLSDYLERLSRESVSEADATRADSAIRMIVADLSRRVSWLQRLAEKYPEFLKPLASKVRYWPMMYSSEPTGLDHHEEHAARLDLGKRVIPISGERAANAAVSRWARELIACIDDNVRYGKMLREQGIYSNRCCGKNREDCFPPWWVMECRRIDDRPSREQYNSLSEGILDRIDDLHARLEFRHIKPSGNSNSPRSRHRRIVEKIMRSLNTYI